MPHDVFISYATKDKPIADAVCVAVETRGFRCWIAPRDVLAGMPYGEAIIDAIQGSRVMVVVFSSNANASSHIPKEVERATADGVTIIPFRIEDVLPAKSLNYFLASLHWLDAHTAPLDPHLQKLADAIAQTLPKVTEQSEAVAPPISRPAPAKTPEKVREKKRAAWWSGKAVMGVAAVVLLAALAGAGWFYRSRMTGGETIDSLAVLPLVNGSGDPKMEFLSDGISESLINSLSQLPNLKVMSRDSAFHYKGKDTDAETVGRELGVRAVFKGSVMQIGDDLAISAELIDARDNSHIWGNQYNRKASDIFALQSDIAMEITSALRTRLTSEDENRITKSYTANPEAYQLYLQGRFWWNKRSQEGYSKALEYFQEAIQKDPNYALAYAGLADCYQTLGGNGVRAPNEVFPKSEQAAQKALQLDNSLVEALPSLALFKATYDLDWSGAEKDFQRAIVLNPNYELTHQWYGYMLLQMGRLDEAVAETKRALELDPLSLVANQNLGLEFYFERHYDQAIEQLRKTIELDSNYTGGHNSLGLAYLQKSMYTEAIAEFEKNLAIAPNGPGRLAELGYGYAVTGRRAEAQKVLDQLNELSKQRYISPASIAMVEVGLGEKDQAFESLQKAFEDRSIGARAIKADPISDPLRSDPRWADLLRRMNLQP